MIRCGYVIDAQNWNAAEEIARIHADVGEPVWMFLVGRGAMPPPGQKVINLSGMSEAQAVRMIAHVDLDVLVDIAGSSLKSMPLIIAMHPARVVIEPLCVPATAGADQRVAPAATAISELVESARNAAHNRTQSLPAGVNGPELGLMLEQAVRSHRTGALEAARAGYGAVLSRYPDHPAALYLLGQWSSQHGRPDDAIASFRRAADVAPEFRDAHHALAQRMAERGEWEAAGDAYRRAVELTPDFAPAWSGLGLASLRRAHGNAKEAIEQLHRATSLDPDSAQWQFNLGTAYQRAGQLPEARGAYERAIALDPKTISAHFNLGAVLQEQGDYPSAALAYCCVLDRDPDFAAAYPELGTCLQLSGRVEEWLDNFRRYRDRCAPSLPMAVYGLEASMAEGDAKAHAWWLDEILSDRLPVSDNKEFVNCWEQLLFLLLHVDVDRGTLRDCYERYDSAAAVEYGPPMRVVIEQHSERCRIGYLSGDLRDHVMGRMIFEWASRHDRSRFDIVLYSLSTRTDEWTERFKRLDAEWVDLSQSSIDEACQRIQRDRIDVLVDCSGPTRGGRPEVLARKPARIQATHIATPGPLGLHAVDYKLTDALSEASDAQRYLIERLMPVPGGVFPWHRYERPSGFADRLSRRSPSSFICGTFVSLMKLSPRCLGLWRRLLEVIPQAKLAFSPAQPEWRDSYVRWLSVHGIANERIVFLPYAEDEAGRLLRYAALDVALDPLPCGNVNGTMEALAMGVPVITLAGVRHGERLGNALLQRFGITDTIAQSEGDYVRIAMSIAGDSAVAESLRGRIADLAVNSPVWDSELQVRRVESVYERMISGQTPAIQT